MIHYFNPGNETAILNQSKYYQPPSIQIKMQNDLEFLPAWYSNDDDFVFLRNNLPENFKDTLTLLNNSVKGITTEDLIANTKLSEQAICLWGLAPNNIHTFEKINKDYKLNLSIPKWQDEYKELSSRNTSHKVLAELIEMLPFIDKDIMPKCFSDINSIEEFLVKSETMQLLKSPFSSSGRGLLWLNPNTLPQSERQITHGILKSQKTVSLEKALNKVFDFSMHFNINNGIEFLGYSVFETNKKGAYTHSKLASQNKLEEAILAYINKNIIEDVKIQLLNILHKTYSSYSGNIGVDMLIYETEQGYKLHPCVEVNMRKSMGYLSLAFFNKYVNLSSNGSFHVEFNASPNAIYQQHLTNTREYPLVIENGKIKSGYLSLCPVNEDSKYIAFVHVRASHKIKTKN
ncbi:hypothetical protein M2138_000237 [Dysgonomonadaceae bacterium PH5-43]|nr:hypothetical protein [Dysgonomonadaceae bacterium PH5-43]